MMNTRVWNTSKQLKVEHEMFYAESAQLDDGDGYTYCTTGSKRWLKTVSEIGKITPWQFLGLILMGLKETYAFEHGHVMHESVEQTVTADWAACIRDALNNGVITPRDDLTGLPIGKMGCLPEMDILDGWWSMSVSDAQKLVDSKGVKFDLKGAAEELYKTMHEPAAKVEAVPVTTPPPIAQGNKLRRNNLDPAIDKAIKQAKSLNLADVYLELKELALAGEKPFTGALDGDALCYTDDNNNTQPAKLAKEALGKRLNRRLPPLADGSRRA